MHCVAFLPWLSKKLGFTQQMAMKTQAFAQGTLSVPGTTQYHWVLAKLSCFEKP